VTGPWMYSCANFATRSTGAHRSTSSSIRDMGLATSWKLSQS